MRIIFIFNNLMEVNSKLKIIFNFRNSRFLYSVFVCVGVLSYRRRSAVLLVVNVTLTRDSVNWFGIKTHQIIYHYIFLFFLSRSNNIIY